MIKPIIIEPYKAKTPWASNKFGDSIGEIWSFSDVKDKECTIQGKELSNWIQDNNYTLEQIYGPTKKANFLVKFILAMENLSIQLHPRPKNECWYILESKNEDEQCGIFLGLPKNTSSSISMPTTKDRLSEINWKTVLDFKKVLPGEIYFVQAGVIHAIGPQVFLLEIQNPVDCTFRLYDWNRGKRPLHLQEAADTLNKIFDTTFNPNIEKSPDSTHFQNEDFSFFIYHYSTSFNLPCFPMGFHLCVCTKGSLELSWTCPKNTRYSLKIKELETILIPYSFNLPYTIHLMDSLNSEFVIIF